MQTSIEFTLNGLAYAVDETHGGFVWSNDLREESASYHATLLDSQQGAITWEAGRRARYEGSAEEAEDARNRHFNQRCDDARGA